MSDRSALRGDRDDVERALAHIRAITAIDPAASLEAQLAAARAAIDHYGDVDARRPDPRVTVQSINIDGLAAEWVCSHDCDPLRRILHLHGGGVLAGSLYSHRPMVSELAVLTDCAVLQIDYRLAPEHGFPAAHDDAFEAFRWMRRHGPQGEAAVREAHLTGDSAGANLAVATIARLIEAGAPGPDRLALISPCLDSTANPARPDRPSDIFVNVAVVAAIMLYIGAETPREHPWVSTLFLPDSALAAFPPTLIQVGTGEFLLPDAQAMAARLAGLDRRVVLSLWPDMPHVWHSFLTLLPQAKAALAEIAAFLGANQAST